MPVIHQTLVPHTMTNINASFYMCSIQWRSQGCAWYDPGPTESWMCSTNKIISNITVKHSIKAVN